MAGEKIHPFEGKGGDPFFLSHQMGGFGVEGWYRVIDQIGNGCVVYLKILPFSFRLV